MYTLTDVTKNYRKGDHAVAALEGLDLSIEDGEWLAIQGRTGSGKTTLLQILGAMDHPSSGAVDFAGRELVRFPETELTEVRAASIGFVFQTFNLIPTLSAIENVEMALIPLRIAGAQRRRALAEALGDVGLGERAHHCLRSCPGGSSNESASLAPWSKRPTSCLPTSQRATSTSTPATRSCRYWRHSGTSTGSPSCWSPTTRPSPSALSASE